MEWSTLLVLVCPIMMIAMMFTMKGGHGHGAPRQEPPSDVSAERLQEGINQLKAENEEIRRELQALKQ